MLRINAPVPQDIADALGLVNRGAASFQLSPVVMLTAQWRTEEAATETALGFNDAETLNGAAFFGTNEQVAAAASYSYNQLFNPAGSGRVVFIDRLIGLCSASSEIRYGFDDTALATLIGGAPNKDGAGAASSSQMRQAQSAALLLDQDCGFCQYTVGTTEVVADFNPPIRLAPGEGFAAYPRVQNINFRVGWEFREYAQ